MVYLVYWSVFININGQGYGYRFLSVSKTSNHRGTYCTALSRTTARNPPCFVVQFPFLGSNKHFLPWVSKAWAMCQARCPICIYMGFPGLRFKIIREFIRRRQWHPTPVLLPGKSHRRRSLVGCSPWGREESDTTERLHFHFSLSCIGEGNGNPLQCSCLENPRDGWAWWAAVCGVAQSRTRLKRLSSSSNVIWDIYR